MSKELINILLVEDDEDDAFLIQHYIKKGLSEGSFTLDHVTSVDSAVACLKAVQYTICLFDYHLGTVNGLDLLREVRSRGIGVPVIFLTGQGDEEVAVEAMKTGATDYLVKHRLAPGVLGSAIFKAIEKHEKERRAKTAERELMQSIAERYENLLQQQEMFRAAINITPQGVILADRQGQVQYMNGMAKTLLDATYGEVDIMRTLTELIRQGTYAEGEIGRVELLGLSLHVYNIPDSGRVVALISQRTREGTTFSALEGTLTRREIEVLELLKEGLHNKAIAAKLLVSPNTVKRHLDNMYSKLGVSSRTELLARAYWLVEN